MNLLLAAATENEISITKKWLDSSLMPVDVLITGVGGVATAYALTSHLLRQPTDLVIQAGIGGSFTEKFPPGSLVLIKDEVFADLGAIENGSLTDIFDMGLEDQQAAPFSHKKLINPNISQWVSTGLPIASGATVNNISSTPVQAQKLVDKYNVDIESMEGAALHYVCLKTKTPFLQVRAISNYCGERDKSKWKLKESISLLNTGLQNIFNRL